MNSQRITWFWPLSFLAALGQLLLLLTHNQGGPAVGRFLLAMWTLWLPGVWLGNLLTKPHTGLPARLPLQATGAVALAYLMLMARAAGLVPMRFLPPAFTGAAVLIGLVFLLVPGNRGGLRRAPRWETREVRRADPQLMVLFAAVLVAVALLSLWAGSPLSLRPDGADHVAAARGAGTTLPGFAAGPYREAAGTALVDPARSLFHPLVDLIARLSNLPPARVWNFLPAAAAPLLLLAVYAAGRALFRDENLGVASSVAFLVLATAGLGNDALRLMSYPDRFAQIPFWMGIALFVEGLDRPHAPGGIALGLVALAALGTHLGFGLLLAASMFAIGTWTWLSVDRFLEGVPLLLVLWVPAAVLGGLYLALRWRLLGSVDPFATPGQGFLVLAPGRWILDPAPFAFGVKVAAAAAAVIWFTLLRRAVEQVTVYALVVPVPLVALLAFTPWLTPHLTRSLGFTLHLVPLVLPLPFLLVAGGDWAARGLARSAGLTWLRFAVLGGSALAVLALAWNGARHFAYRPGTVAAEREAPPGSSRPLAEALSAVLPPGAPVLADPATAAALAAYTPVRSAYAPSGTSGMNREALVRLLAARQALMVRAPETGTGESPPDSILTGPAAPAGHGHRDALLRFLRAFPVRAVVVNHLPARRSFDDLWRTAPGDNVLLEGWLHADSTRFHPAPLDPWGTAFMVAAPPPGPGPEAWLAAPPGPPLPPANLRGPAPALDSVLVDTTAVASGETLAVTARWARPAAGIDYDPRGYRYRMELHPVPVGPPSVRSWLRLRWRSVADLLSGRRHGWGGEWPLAGGDPPAWWDGPVTARSEIRIPSWLAPGTYEVRARALPGPHPFDRVRRGLTYLPPLPRPVLVRVTAGR